MSSIVTAVFKATIGLLVNNGRDKAAEKLKDGDVTDQKIRELIVREIDDIKTKLDGLARKDLLTSISYFRRGVGGLLELLEKAERSSHGSAKNLDASLRSKATAATEKTVSIAGSFKSLIITDLDDGDKRLLANSKEEFKIACLKATEAFNNEALSTYDRIQAMVIRVAATILERVDYPQDALTACRLCLEELHSMPAVQGSFTVEFKKGFWARFSKTVRSEIIVMVYRLNRVIYDMMSMVCDGVDRDMVENWPLVDLREEKVSVLSDRRVRESLCKMGLEHYWDPITWSLLWSFGELMDPVCVDTNSEGKFIVAEQVRGVTVFDYTGRYTYSLETPSCDVIRVHDVATDKSDSIYVLMNFLPHYPISDLFELDDIKFKSPWVYCYSKYASTPFSYFPLRTSKEQARYHSLTVGDNNNVLVLGKELTQSGSEVAVFEPDGQFVRTFGEERLSEAASDISAVIDGCVMVLDSGAACVRVFSEDGAHLFHFQIEKSLQYSKIGFSRLYDRVVVAADKKVLIYTRLGHYLCDFKVNANKIQGITVSDRRIALACTDEKRKSEVRVLGGLIP